MMLWFSIALNKILNEIWIALNTAAAYIVLITDSHQIVFSDT